MSVSSVLSLIKYRSAWSNKGDNKAGWQVNYPLFVLLPFQFQMFVSQSVHHEYRSLRNVLAGLFTNEFGLLNILFSTSENYSICLYSCSLLTNELQ